MPHLAVSPRHLSVGLRAHAAHRSASRHAPSFISDTTLDLILFTGG